MRDGVSAGSDMALLAIVKVGTTAIGIEIAAVVQALPLPDRLTPLPRRRGAIAGVADCDGEPLPVVDLAGWVETGPAPADTQRRILVLREGARRIGMLVDAVEGFAEVPRRALVRLAHDDDADEVFQSVATVPATGVQLGVLEVGRLMTLARAWHEGDDEGEEGEGDAAVRAAVAETAEAAGPAAARTLCAVLRAGRALLALPAVRLAAVEPYPEVNRIGAGTFCTWRGRHMPVLDACTVLGEGSMPAARPLLAVVDYGGRLLGMAVDATVDMRALPEPGPGAASCTVHDDAGDAVAFVMVEPLFARFPETALSLQNGEPAAQQGRQARNRVAQMLFDAGTTLAVPADAVEHVLPLARGDGAPPATLLWQGRTIAVVDLRRDRRHGHVMIVRHDAVYSACIVERIRSLVPAGGARLFTLAQPGRGAATFVEVLEGDERGSYRVVDAQGLIAMAPAA